MKSLSEVNRCPGLFYATAAQDGGLSRLRLPGGILNWQQCEAIIDLVEQFGGSIVQLTNRANIQIRELPNSVPAFYLQRLQAVGVASCIPEVDAIRNIMASPTAGIDPQALVDTQPFVQEWNHFLNHHPELGVLSPKFSVYFDGGETVSALDRPNDIALVAERWQDQIWFRLYLGAGDRGTSPLPTAVLVRPEDSVGLLGALAAVYRDYTVAQYSETDRPPRLRALLQAWGIERFLQEVEAYAGALAGALCRSSDNPTSKVTRRSYRHLGLHPQRQSGLFYLGVSVPLGRLLTAQLQGLMALCTQYGQGTLRLTPWQTLLLSDLPQQYCTQVIQQVEDLGLYPTATHPSSAVVACSGTTGCSAALTNTQRDALACITQMEEHQFLDAPLNLHFSGCDKSCAQHQPGDITLIGTAPDTYRLYVGDYPFPFGQELAAAVPAAQIPDQIAEMMRVYHCYRRDRTEDFSHFVNAHSLTELQQWFTPQVSQP
jgi:ferredoxin-nitrite reductase